MMSKVSVIVTVYNKSQYITRCLESVVNQTMKELEIIIVDDGSTDGSSDICDEFAKKDSRVNVIHQINLGPAAARKTGLSYSTGEYIAYVDGDDWVDLSAYEEMYNDARETGVDICIYEHFNVVEDAVKQIHNSIVPGYYGKERLLKTVYPNMLMGDDFFEWVIFSSMCVMLYRRELLEKVLAKVDNRLTVGEDFSCCYFALLESDSVYFSDKSYYFYRQSTDSLVKTVENTIVERERYDILYKTVKNEFAKYGCSSEIMTKWENYLLFVMIPRSDQLYDGLEELDYIFPFRNIKKGTRVALYCAGTYGQRLYNYLQRTGVANVVVWVDQNYRELQRMGLPVENPCSLNEYEYDGIIVANMFAKSRRAIYEYCMSLDSRVPVGKIDEDFVLSKSVKKGFRLV